MHTLKLLILLMIVFEATAQDIQFESTTYSFGKLKKGAACRTTFTCTNKGNKPITLLSANTSCGCDVPYYTPRQAILPGQSVEIGYMYDSQRVGPFTKGMTVVFDNNYTVYLKVCGVIYDPTLPYEAVLPCGCQEKKTAPESPIEQPVLQAGSDRLEQTQPIIPELNTAASFSMQISPNPAQNDVRIQFSTEVKNAHLLLYDLNGRIAGEWKHIEGNEFIIQRGQLAAGNYHLLLFDSEKRRADKMLIFVDE